MKIEGKTKLLGVVLASATLGLTGTFAAGAAQASHQGGAVATHAVVANAKAKKVAFHGKYSGTIALLWSANAVTATSATGTGSSSALGVATLKGTGSSSPTSTCDPFSGAGTISSAKGKLVFRIVSSSKQQACAAGSAAPTTVSVKGIATVTNGTGVYAKAKGTLTVKGSFSIQSTTAGSNESDTFTATLAGTLTVNG